MNLHYDILIVEDDVVRMNRIKKFVIGHHYIWCKSADEALNILKSGTVDIDFIMLDHDLAEDHYGCDTSGVGTGYEVAEWIAQNQFPVKFIFIHSLNPVGSETIHKVLDRYNIPNAKVPGCWSRFESFSKMFA